MSLSKANVDTELVVSTKPKYSLSSDLIIELRREIKERPTRKGFGLTNWPLWDLALNYAVYSSFPDKTARDKMHILLSIDQEIAERYEERNGRVLSHRVLYNRYDKGIRQMEVRRYSHLLTDAFKVVEDWECNL